MVILSDQYWILHIDCWIFRLIISRRRLRQGWQRRCRLQGVPRRAEHLWQQCGQHWEIEVRFLAWKFQEPSDTVFHMSFRFIVMLWKLQVRFPNLWHWRRWLHIAGGTLHGDETQTPRWNDFNFVTFRCCRWWWATTWRRSSCTAWWTGELTLDICLLSRKSPSSGRSRTPTRTWTGGLVSRSLRASSESWAGRSPRRWWCKFDHWLSNRGGSARSWRRSWYSISRRKPFK